MPLAIYCLASLIQDLSRHYFMFRCFKTRIISWKGYYLIFPQMWLVIPRVRDTSPFHQNHPITMLLLDRCVDFKLTKKLPLKPLFRASGQGIMCDSFGQDCRRVFRFDQHFTITNVLQDPLGCSAVALVHKQFTYFPWRFLVTQGDILKRNQANH